VSLPMLRCLLQRNPTSAPFPYTTLFRSRAERDVGRQRGLTHRRTPGEDDEVGGVQSAELLVEIGEPGRHAHRLTVALECRLGQRSEEHTSELQSPDHLVCRLLPVKKTI